MADTFKIVNGDWVVDQANGGLITVSGKDKTRQDFGELLSIAIQKYGFGAGIVDLVGKVSENPFSISFDVMRKINDAVARWIGLQRKQRAVMTDDEIVTRLVFNQAKLDEANPTTVIFRASILTRSHDEVARGGTILVA